LDLVQPTPVLTAVRLITPIMYLAPQLLLLLLSLS
jgi:hypothetical protein